jgi:aminopeptidase
LKPTNVNPLPAFPPFDLARLLKTVFNPSAGDRVAILIDLEEPRAVKKFGFLKDEKLVVQHMAHEVFFQGLHAGGVMQALGLVDGHFFAYKTTKGSNLDLPDEAFDLDGQQLSFDRDIYPRYDLFLVISTYSATAPLTAKAKQFGFRGATLHGLNPLILSTGLSVDYNEVSATAERMRLAMTNADHFDITFHCFDQDYQLRVLINGRPAQKSHGMARERRPDVVNLPGGEVYYVPAGAEGKFPRRYEDGTIGLLHVTGGRITQADLIKGDQKVIDFQNYKLSVEPMAGLLGELGLGTQQLPPAGCDIQDEKIFGTLHVATGRSDHLGGDLSPTEFKVKEYATHDDILFAPFKTPEIQLSQATMTRHGETVTLIENDKPTDFYVKLRNG